MVARILEWEMKFNKLQKLKGQFQTFSTKNRKFRNSITENRVNNILSLQLQTHGENEKQQTVNGNNVIINGNKCLLRCRNSIITTMRTVNC